MKTLAFLCRALLSISALSALPSPTFAGDLPLWPLPSVPAGGNPAIVPSPRSDWMAHFVRNVDAAKHGPVNLVFDGDSITDFWPTKAPELWKNYAKFGAVDFGISGDKTENLLWRLADGQVDGLKPKLVALMIGTNNLARDKDEQIAEGVEKIVQEYRQRCPDATILLQGVFPRGAPPDDHFRTRIQHINSLIAKLGDGKKVIYLDFGAKFLQPDGTLSADIMPDALHPSAKGYEIWSAAIQPVIDQVLGSGK